MTRGRDDGGEYVELLLEDLSEKAQKELETFLDDNGNFDVFPIAKIYKGDDT